MTGVPPTARQSGSPAASEFEALGVDRLWVLAAPPPRSRLLEAR